MRIKQRDITDCGAACLASVSKYYHLNLSTAKIRQIAHTNQEGTSVLGLQTAAEKLGFLAKGAKGNLQSLLKIPTPAIAHIVEKDLHHFVVIYKVQADKVKYMDPADGEYHWEKLQDFEKKWSGVLVLLIPSETFEAKNEKISNLSRFWYLVMPHKTMLLQVLFGALAYTLLGLSMSIYIGKITDNVLVNNNQNLLNLLSVAMIAILGLQVFIGAHKSIFMLKTGQKIDARLILGYYKHLLKLPQPFFDTMRIGEVVSRVNDAVKIRAFINETAIEVFVNIATVLFSFVLMFTYHWKLALIMVLILPIYLVIYLVVNRLNKRNERKLMEKSADLESQLFESINSVRTIKQFGIEQYTNVQTETKFINLLRAVFKSGQNSLFAYFSTEFANKLFTIVLMWVGCYYVMDQTITAGELLSFYALIGYYTGPLAALVGVNKTIQNALIAADRLFEIMDLEREEATNKIDLSNDMVGDIVFENVSFSYNVNQSLFEDFNLRVKKGQKTAILGESGSGKTTLAGLLQKLYPISEGKIWIGSHSLEYLTNSSLREKISTVPQQLHLFNGNVIQNIAVGTYEPDLKRILQICHDLGITSFVEKLPKGFETNLGENGAILSGGQKQRLAIARALYKDPDIIILDEATSALDSESEAYVQNAIDRFKKQGKTILIIAHRLSTILDSDKIVVLADGKVVEEGNHSDLYSAQGKYYHMWQLQMPFGNNRMLIPKLYPHSHEN